MINQDLLNYIRDSLSKNFPRDQIRDALIDAGWRLDDINEAFSYLKETEKSKITINSPARKKAMALVFAAAVFLFTGSSVFAGYYYYKTIPERTVSKMKENLKDIRSFGYEAKIKFESEGSGTLELNSKGAADFSDENNIKSYSDSSFSASSPLISEKEKISLSLSHKGIKEAHYLKFSIPKTGGELPALSFLDLNRLNGKWIKIDSSDLENYFQAEYSPESEFLDDGFQSGSDFNSPEPENLQDKTYKENIGKLKEIFSKHKIFAVEEYIGSEIIQDGVKARHIKFQVNKEELGNFFQEAQKEFNSAFGDYRAEEIENISGDIWIGKEDSFLRKFYLLGNFKDEKNKKGKWEISLEFFDINEPVFVEAPEKSESITDIAK